MLVGLVLVSLLCPFPFPRHSCVEPLTPSLFWLLPWRLEYVKSASLGGYYSQVHVFSFLLSLCSLAFVDVRAAQLTLIVVSRVRRPG